MIVYLRWRKKLCIKFEDYVLNKLDQYKNENKNTKITLNLETTQNTCTERKIY